MASIICSSLRATVAAAQAVLLRHCGLKRCNSFEVCSINKAMVSAPSKVTLINVHKMLARCCGSCFPSINTRRAAAARASHTAPGHSTAKVAKVQALFATHCGRNSGATSTVAASNSLSRLSLLDSRAAKAHAVCATSSPENCSSLHQFLDAKGRETSCKKGCSAYVIFAEACTVLAKAREDQFLRSRSS